MLGFVGSFYFCILTPMVRGGLVFNRKGEKGATHDPLSVIFQHMFSFLCLFIAIIYTWEHVPSLIL